MTTAKPYSITILWGDDAQPEEGPQTYSFKTKAELEAFKLGADEAIGWGDYAVWPEGEEFAKRVRA
jgi:hypothetical protein